MKMFEASVNGFRRVAALGCLLAFSLGPTQVLPMTFALAAGAEGSHTVLVGTTAGGATKVILRHAPEGVAVGAGGGARHRHGLASRAICLLANSSGSEADHVAAFACGEAAEGTPEAARLQSGDAAPPSFAVDSAAAGCGTWVSPLLSRGAHRACCVSSASLLSPWQRCLRTTCLLI